MTTDAGAYGCEAFFFDDFTAAFFVVRRFVADFLGDSADFGALVVFSAAGAFGVFVMALPSC